MRECANIISSRGFRVSKEKMFSLFNKSVIQYNQAVSQFFNWGYCSLPTLSYQDMDKLYEAIISEFPDLREQFFNHMTGSFTVTPLSIEYLCKFEEDKEKLVVLQALHCLLAAKETIDSINTLISFTRVPKRADTFQATLNLSVSSNIRCTNAFPLNSTSLVDMLVLDEDTELLGVCLNEFRLDSLGISDISGLGREADARYLSLFLSGAMIGRGEGGQALYDKILHTYTDYYSGNVGVTRCMKFEASTFLETIKVCSEGLSKYKTQGTPVYMNDDYVYFAVPKGEGVLQAETYTDFYIGLAPYDWIDGRQSAVYSQLKGLSGEFISASDVRSLGFKATCPAIQVRTHTKAGAENTTEFYPVEYVFSDDERLDSRMFGLANVFMTADDVKKLLDTDNLFMIHKEVADCIQCSYAGHTYDYRLLVGYLVEAIALTLCNEVAPGREAPNHVVLDESFSWVSSDVYNQACIDCEILCNQLGL